MKKILFMDDEKDLFAVVSNVFPKESFRVIYAADGVEGLFKCRNEVFDIIICDYKMPKMDGQKFFIQLRDLETVKDQKTTPVLFISGFGEEFLSKKMQGTQFDFLAKPFNLDDLVSKVTKLLLGEAPKEKKDESAKEDSKVTFTKGHVLWNEGDEGKTMYYVMSGVLAAFKKTQDGKEILIGTVKAGELIGEMGLIDGSQRSLKVVVQEPVELVPISEEKFKAIMSTQSKWVKLMLGGLTKRLRETLKLVG